MSYTSLDESKFRVKRIYHEKFQRIIILQSYNGPCPLIAICNILSLSGLVSLQHCIDSDGYLTRNTLCTVVVDYVMKRLRRSGSTTASCTRNEIAVHDVVELVPLLFDGMNINVKFDGVDSFENTREQEVLDACGVRLVHGWLIDPHEEDIRQEVRGRCFNAMTAQRTEGNAQLFAHWMDENASQLSFSGLFALTAEVVEGSLVVFFRNNHFSVLTKHGSILYTLLTDSEAANDHQGVTWQSLEDVDGSASRFVNLFPQRSVTPPPPSLLAPITAVPMHNRREQVGLHGQQPIYQPEHYFPRPGEMVMTGTVVARPVDEGKKRKMKEDSDCCIM